MSLELLSLRQFKCFAAADVPVAPLTLLSGFNAGGKSTTLQSLLLLAQGMRASPRSCFLQLNGPVVRLGSAGNVMRRGRRQPIRFGVQGFGHTLRWELGATFDQQAMVETQLEPSEDRGGDEGEQADDDEDVSERQRLQVLQVFLDDKPLFNDSTPQLSPHIRDVTKLRTAIRNLIFLGAARHSRLDVFPSPDDASPIYADVGHEGQFAPWWYVHTADNTVRSSRRRPGDSSVTVRAQVDAWLDYLFPGASANAEKVRGTGLSRLVFKMGRTNDWSHPANTGFGLSYAFPLVVALLNAKPGRVVIVDSPEAHLHPRAQSRMGTMLAVFAAAGVQVLVETHSDHILSGVRLAVRRKEIAPEKVAVHFFSGRMTDSENGIISPVVYSDGRTQRLAGGVF